MGGKVDCKRAHGWDVTVLSIKGMLCWNKCVCDVVCDRGTDGESGGSLVPEEPVGGNAFCYFLLPGHLSSHRRG